MRDYHLHELSSNEFENLIIHICQQILGIGTLNFSEGPDGGRDGKFEGVANHYPSNVKPWSGRFVIQAKKINNPNSSCSQSDFKTKILDKEIPKILKLKQIGEVDNYLIFTNRKLPAQSEQSHIKYLREKLGLSNLAIFGVEAITIWLDANPAIVYKVN